MGVLNVTPDSFSDGGETFDPGRAIERALQMEADGADLIDVGAESTRPGAEAIDPAEEWRRLRPVFKGLAGRVRVGRARPLSGAAEHADPLHIHSEAANSAVSVPE